MPTTVLAAGDHFVLPRLLTEELRSSVPDRGALDIRELRLPWPHTPFGKVAEVDEASGTEEELIEALRGRRLCMTRMAPLTERVLRACPDLELFCVSRGGPVNATTRRSGPAVARPGSPLNGVPHLGKLSLSRYAPSSSRRPDAAAGHLRDRGTAGRAGAGGAARPSGALGQRLREHQGHGHGP
ncbi:hypothetical protein [Streptomyces iranensis]|uniref:2-hydroxyacid family dehydrogenase n=1 Tax=Streptomyces iranensis TaxID=576784 RepID=A0A061A7A7_9ACTN|nr:hypothetical protein [Streptomyces iranensis]MBP2059995.1 hypothetical protein [Streptomyces iranensis]CDR14333.1 2-hydroxyacid family dehydrogenase [Streptomyces iranensis]